MRAVGRSSSSQSKSSGFTSERELVDYIELNLPIFCETIAHIGYAEHEREWPLSPGQRFGANRPKIDLMVRSHDGKRIGIECKYPRGGNFQELSRAVSQILSYAVIARDNGVPFNSLFLVTTEYDNIVDRVIQAYELPIHVIVFCKEMHGSWFSPYLGTGATQVKRSV